MLAVANLQAEIALKRAFYLHNDRWVVPFSSAALSYIIGNIQTELKSELLVSPELIRLNEYDEEKGTEYFITLKTYLENERDIPKTAAVLVIHRTTLTYRLDKIQKMLRLNLDDPDTRLYLLISLRLSPFRSQL